MREKKRIQSQNFAWTVIASVMVSLHYGILLGIVFPLAIGYILLLLFTSWQHCRVEGGGSLGCEHWPGYTGLPHTNLLCDQPMFSSSVSPDGECL